MTKRVKKIFDKMNGDELRKAASLYVDNKEYVKYLEERLEKLNIDVAMVEPSEIKVGEV